MTPGTDPTKIPGLLGEAMANKRPAQQVDLPFEPEPLIEELREPGGLKAATLAEAS